MRKILSIIASFLILSVAITSCLDSDNNYELSSDDIINGFKIDDIYGVQYKFTIDQIEGKIYNVDSVPYSADTIINKIKTTISTNGYVLSGETQEKDTFLFATTDSLDLLNTMNKPLVVRVYSADGNYIKQYSIEVRIHLTDPDSLVWGGKEQKPYTESFSSGVVLANQETKTVSLDEKVLTFVPNGTDIDMYEKGAEGQSWTKYPAVLTNTKMSSIISYNDKLFAVTDDNKVVQSADGGQNWSEVLSADAESNPIKVTTLLTTFTDDSQNEVRTDISICGITQAEVNAETVYYFSSATVDDNGNLTWTIGDKKPEDFPSNRISATKSFKTNTGMQRAVLVGEPKTDAATVPWFSLNGTNWTPMPTSEKYALPNMERPSIIYYGETYYAFGGEFSTMYTSINGQVWTEVKKKFLLPSDKDSKPIFEGRTGYSMTVDKDNYIWIVWGNNTNYTDQVWRGKLNRLGFIIQ